MSNADLYASNLRSIAAQKTKEYVIKFFPESDLRSGHAGLSAKARENGISTEKMKPGEFLIFVNRARSQLKMYAAGQTIAHVKAPKNNMIDYRVVKYVPRFFNGTQINFKEAQKAALKEKHPELF